MSLLRRYTFDLRSEIKESPIQVCPTCSHYYNADEADAQLALLRQREEENEKLKQGNELLLDTNGELRLRLKGMPTTFVEDELRDQLAAETAIIDRVWKALGITTYEQANGKAIDELVSELRATLAEALRLQELNAVDLRLVMQQLVAMTAERDDSQEQRDKRIVELEGQKIGLRQQLAAAQATITALDGEP